MTYDPNRDPGGRDLIGRNRGMWGWIIAIAAVVVLGIIVWASIDTGSEVARKDTPATQSSQQPATTGGASTSGSGTAGDTSGAGQKGGTQSGAAPPSDDATTPGGGNR